MASLATDMEQLSVQENEEMHLQKISKKSGQVPFDAENWWLKKLPEIKAQVVIDCAYDKDWDDDKKGYNNAALRQEENGLAHRCITVDMPDFYGNNFDDALNEFFTKYYNSSPKDYVKFDVKLGAPIPCAITGEKILDHEVCLHATFTNKKSNKDHWLKMFAQAVRSNPQFQCYFHIDRVTIPYEEIFTGWHKKEDIASMKQKIKDLRAKGLEIKAGILTPDIALFQSLDIRPKDAIRIHWDDTTADVTKQKIYDAKITKVYTPTKTLGYRVGVSYANRGGKEIIPVGDFIKRLDSLDDVLKLREERAEKKKNLEQDMNRVTKNSFLNWDKETFHKKHFDDLTHPFFFDYYKVKDCPNGSMGEIAADMSQFFLLRKKSLHWWKIDLCVVRPVAPKKWKHLVDAKKFEDINLDDLYEDYIKLCNDSNVFWVPDLKKYDYFNNVLEIHGN